MSIKLSYFFADFFVARNWIKGEDKLIYIVGLDVIFSTLEQLFIVILIGLWRGRLIETVIYLLFFSTVRKYCGGYHAATRAGCMAVFTIVYLQQMNFLCSYVEALIYMYFLYMAYAVFFLPILFFISLYRLRMIENAMLNIKRKI